VEAALAHPVFDSLRPSLGKLDGRHAPFGTSLEQLNALAEAAGLRVGSGSPLRFVPPSRSANRYGDYEMRVFNSGCVETRPDSKHDLFNAFAWLGFPKTKARLNALHAAEIPRERGRRGRFRDLLTLIDEGGAIIECGDAELIDMLRGFRWRELFWENRGRVLRSMRVHVLGHAVLEQALRPWPGITCKVIFVAPGADPDAQAATWLGGLPRQATPRELAPLPVFGFPGWFPGSDRPEFYEDSRFFRPFQRALPGKMTAGVGQAAAASRSEWRAEESPGSAERDAG
jgi:hypothetical protein